MADLWNFPYFEVQFHKTGGLVFPEEAAQIPELVARDQSTDLIVLSHGWNNDMDAARGLYRRFLEQVRGVIDSGVVPRLETRTFAVLGVLWPSKRFAESDLIPGGAASIGAADGNWDLQEQIDDLHGVFDDAAADDVLERARELTAQLEDSTSAQREFADLVRSVVPQHGDAEDASDQLFSIPGDTLLERLSRPIFPGDRRRLRGGAAVATAGTGGAAGLGGRVSGLRAGAQRLLNYVTYYQMKERSGQIGRHSMNSLLATVRARNDNLRIHLVGHSFGGRLVSAAAAGPEGKPSIKPSSLTLLQAAFSHHGFAQRYDGRNDGLFRPVVSEQRVAGPILITCTPNDTAVGLAYPLASLVAGQVAAALGDKDDLYGAIGRNGAQKTPEAIESQLLPVGSQYHFEAGAVYNLSADAFIADHGDVTGAEVAYALLTGIGAT